MKTVKKGNKFSKVKA